MFENRLAAQLIVSVLLSLPALGWSQDEDFDTQMMRATVKIQHDKSTATGFILALSPEKEYVLVTAAHVFENTPDDETKVVFRHLKSEGEYEKKPVPLKLREEGRPTWVKHPTQDVAVIRIEPPADADLSSVSWEVLADDEALRQARVHPGDELHSLGYPHREEGSPAGFPILRIGPIASYPLLPTAKTKKFFLSANTFEGDSGSPAYLIRSPVAGTDQAETRLIIGLISAQQFLNEEAKLIYGTTILKHRLGLAVVVHASFIREAIEILQKEPRP